MSLPDCQPVRQSERPKSRLTFGLALRTEYSNHSKQNQHRQSYVERDDERNTVRNATPSHGTRSLVFTSLASTLPTSALDGTAAEGVGTLDGEERGVDEEGRGSLLVSRLACSTSTAARLTLLTPPPSACASASLSPYTPPVLCGGRAYNTGGTASCPRRSSFARQ